MTRQTISLRQGAKAPWNVRPAKNDAEMPRPRHRKRRIRCPHCGWQPDGKPYWQCELCYTVFDTFATRAHCPNRACGNSWPQTQCIRCNILSPHEQWYTDEE